MWPQGGSAEQDDATGVKKAGGLGHVTLGHVTLALTCRSSVKCGCSFLLLFLVGCHGNCFLGCSITADNCWGYCLCPPGGDVTKQPGAVWRPAGGDTLTLFPQCFLFRRSFHYLLLLIWFFILINVFPLLYQSLPPGGAVSHDRYMTNVFESVANDD